MYYVCGYIYTNECIKLIEDGLKENEGTLKLLLGSDMALPVLVSVCSMHVYV